MKQHILDLQSFLQEEFSLKTYTDRLADTNESKSALLYLSDNNPFAGSGKTRTYRIVLVVRYKLDAIVQGTTKFNELDAQMDAYTIWDRLVSEGVSGLRLKDISTRFGEDVKKRYVFESVFSCSKGEGS